MFILYNCGFVSLYATRDHKKWFSDTAKRAAMKLKKQYGVWIKIYSDSLGLPWRGAICPRRPFSAWMRAARELPFIFRFEHLNAANQESELIREVVDVRLVPLLGY